MGRSGEGHKRLGSIVKQKCQNAVTLTFPIANDGRRD